MNKWVVDRFEEHMAVLENETGSITVFTEDLPSGVQEGSTLIKKDNTFIIDDSEAVTIRSEKIRERFGKLKKKVK